MARGGYRPNSGPAKGTKYKPRKPKPGTKKPKKIKEPTERDKIKQMLSMGTKAKARFYQDFLMRVSRGEKLSVTEQKAMERLGAELAAEVNDEKPPASVEAGETDIEAVAYLRKVWNDSSIEHALRIRAAEIVYKGPGDKLGKKEQNDERAKAASAGRFSPSKPPKLKIVGKEK